MINVTIGVPNNKYEKLVSEDRTIKSVLDEYAPGYERATNYLDGCPITAETMHKTFEELHITEACAIISVIKLDNAVTL